jgi:GTP cyclohydrolase II
MDYIKKYIGEQVEFKSRTWGKLTVEVASFTPASDGDLVIFIGKPFEEDTPLIRIHSECVFAEALDSDLCDCADQLKLALNRLVSEGNGILFYLRFDGRGAGLAAKLKATALEVRGIDTYESRLKIGVEPEGRNFFSIGQYLFNKGIKKVRLLTNNPLKGKGLEDAGIIVFYEPLLISEPSKNVRKLYKTKANKFHHFIPPKLV